MTNVQDHGVLPTNDGITNTANLRAVTVLSDSARLLVDFIIEYVGKHPHDNTFVDENGVKRHSWFLNHEYPIMEDRNHEVEDPEGKIERRGKRYRVEVIQEQAWVHCSPEVIREAEDHLMSLGYRCDRPELKMNNDAEFAHLPLDERPPIRRKPLRGCFVVPPLKVK